MLREEERGDGGRSGLRGHPGRPGDSNTWGRRADGQADSPVLWEAGHLQRLTAANKWGRPGQGRGPSLLVYRPDQDLKPCNRENLEPKPARQGPGCMPQGASVHYQHPGTPAQAHPPQLHPGKHFLVTGESCCPLCQLTAPPGSSPGNSTPHKAPSPSTAHGLQLLPAWLSTLKAEDAFLDNGPQEGPPREGPLNPPAPEHGCYPLPP